LSFGCSYICFASVRQVIGWTLQWCSRHQDPNWSGNPDSNHVSLFVEAGRV